MGDDLMNLVRDAQQGNRSAVAAVLEDVLPDVRAYVRVNIGTKIRARESASDPVQSIGREVLEDLGDQPRAFRKWLFSLALNKIRGRNVVMKSQRRDVDRKVAQRTGFDELMTCYSRISTPSRIAQAREGVERVEVAMAKLPDEYREVITKKCILQMSHEEIAEEMDRPEATVRRLLSRARAKLSLLIAKAEMGGWDLRGRVPTHRRKRRSGLPLFGDMVLAVCRND